MNRTRIEDEIIITLVRNKNSTKIINKYIELIDWNMFFEKINYHKILSFISKKLLDLNNNKQIELHENIVIRLKKELLYQIGKRHILKRELVRLKDSFKKENINIVVSKGFGFAETIYMNNFRDFNDIDLLVKSSKVIQVHNVLVNSGYQVIEKGKEINVSRGMLENKIITSSHLYKYVKDNVSIEIHQTKNTFIRYNKIFDNSKNICSSTLFCNTYLAPDLIDSFIIACDHLWHHFPLSMGSMKNNSCAVIKEVMDVYVAYNRIEASGSINEIINRSKELNAYEIVLTMLTACEEIYGEFFYNRKILEGVCKKHINWKSTFYNSKFIDRLVSCNQEYQRIREIFSNRHINNKHIIYDISTLNDFEGDIPINISKNKLIEFSEYRENTTFFWNTSINYSTRVLNDEINAKFSLFRDNSFLYMLLILDKDKFNNISNNKVYDNNYNNLILYFGNHIDNKPNAIYIQPNKNGKIYYLCTKNSLYINNGSMQIIDNNLVMFYKVPWEVIDTSKKEILFDFCIECKNRKKGISEIHFWAGGNGAETNNCSTMSKFIWD